MTKRMLFCLLGVWLVVSPVFAQETNTQAPNSPENNTTSGKNSIKDMFNFDWKKQPIVADGAYTKVIEKERIALPQPHIREADVMWSKRIWRVIDMREKQNRQFMAEEKNFVEVLLDIVAQQPDVQLFYDDGFKEPLTRNALYQRLETSDTVEVYNFETGEIDLQKINNEPNFEDVRQVRIKEDWIFDSARSVMDPRIIALAVVRDVIDPDTDIIRGQEVLFWVPYAQIRPYLAKYDSYNPYNDSLHLSWADILDMRFFASYIMKESNPQDKRISEYASGRDALLESERIKEELLKYESYLWSY
ncbi:MAG: gliding motility protein GldN [Chitinophagales bacterium]